MTREIHSADPVSAGDIRAVRFPLVRRGGYDPRQVDPFLEVIAQTLEGGPLAESAIDAHYVHRIRFATVRRSGYDAKKVDAFLDRIIDTLDPTNAPAAAPVAVPAAATVEPDPVPTPAPVSRAVPKVRTVRSVPAPTESAPTPVAAASPIEEGQAHLDRLRALYHDGLLSEKEVAVIAGRVKRRARQQMDDLEAATAGAAVPTEPARSTA